jgi:molybdopterin molybdotransferase
VSGRGVDPEEEAELLAVQTYLEHVLSLVEPLEPREVPLADAWGSVLAVDVRAPFDLPSFVSSAMDGYAVRSADLAQTPVRLRVIGVVSMGRATTLEVGPGEAVAVPTGGVVPVGADAVVPIELCELEDGQVLILRAHPAGKHVRPAGEDVRAGELLIPGGRRLAAPDVGTLAAAGIGSVSVRPRVRVGIVSTGDELVRPPSPLHETQIYDANAYTLIAAVREAGGEAVDGGMVPDDPDALVAALDALDDGVDALVCSGGVSMGVHDPVKRAFETGQDGAKRLPRTDVGFFNVGMQPGRPQAVGRWRGKPFFGLPGNAVSVLVSFEVFVRPALQKMMGYDKPRPTVDAVLEGDLDAPRSRARYARVRVRREDGRFIATPQSTHRSNLLASFARSDGLVVIDPGKRLASGQTCRVILIREAMT